MNKLCGARAYLCGAMDRVPDMGRKWRTDIADFLINLGVVVLDPLCKDTLIDIGIEEQVSHDRIDLWKVNGEFSKIAQEMKSIRHVDLRGVDVVDFLVVNIDIDVHACGTYEELFWANREKKPCLCHIEGGLQCTPNWLFATLPLHHLFDSWDKLQHYLTVIHEYGSIYDERWTLYDFGLPTLRALIKAAEHNVELHSMLMKYNKDKM